MMPRHVCQLTHCPLACPNSPSRPPPRPPLVGKPSSPVAPPYVCSYSSNRDLRPSTSGTADWTPCRLADCSARARVWAPAQSHASPDSNRTRMAVPRVRHSPSLALRRLPAALWATRVGPMLGPMLSMGGRAGGPSPGRQQRACSRSIPWRNAARCPHSSQRAARPAVDAGAVPGWAGQAPPRHATKWA